MLFNSYLFIFIFLPVELIGWFSLPEIKHGFFADCDIGIVIEDNNSERFWCHFKKQSIDWMVAKYDRGII